MVVGVWGRGAVGCMVVVGWEEEADELFFINSSCSSTILLPDEGYAHDDHYYSVHDCSDDGRSPDGLLI